MTELISEERVDFRSGCNLNRLDHLIRVFDDFDRHEFDDQMAMEVNTMKEHVFGILGEVQKLDEKLPPTNEYLLLSGNAREGTLDIDVDEPSSLTRGNDYDLDYTLFVPILKMHDRNQPVALDMRQSIACHSWITLKMFDQNMIDQWDSCSSVVEIQEEKNHYLSPLKVCTWFNESVHTVVDKLVKNPKRGDPKILTCEKNGVSTTIVMMNGGTRIMYDIVPVVSFRGWPAVAMGWLSEPHFWDNIVQEDEVITGFHLVPASSTMGKQDVEWRLSFARSEVQLKRYIPGAFMKTFYAYKAIMTRALGRYCKIIKPYILRSLLLWACDRVKLEQLAKEETISDMLLGLIDDMLQCLISRSCPNYFIPQCNMIGHLDDETVLKLCQVVLMVRSDPAEHVRNAVDQVKMARQLTKEHHEKQMKLILLRKDVNGSGEQAASGGANGTNGASTNSRDEMDLAEKIRRLVDSNPGKSISVLLNPENSSTSHIRIDDKFF